MSTTALLLGLCQFLFMAAAAASIAFGGIVGEQLATNPNWATLPFLAMTGTTALLTLVMPRLFRHFGYRTLLACGCIAGASGAALAAWAIGASSFTVFCLAAALLGVYQASALYYRFAAADAASPAAKGRAVAWVMSGGIPAAFAGPLLGAHLVNLLPAPYAGSYLAAGLLALFAVPLILAAKLPHERRSQGQHEVALSFAQALQTPYVSTAVVFCAGGYGAMMLVMLATPLSLAEHENAAAHSASVIQWHLLGMFAPSLLTGKLIDRWAPVPVGVLGSLLLALACGVAWYQPGLAAVHLALLLIGVGWNLMYMSGTALLTRITNDAARAKLQGLNECVTFVVMTLTAGAAGWIYYSLGWHSTLLVATTVAGTAALAGLAALLRQRPVTGPSAA